MHKIYVYGTLRPNKGKTLRIKGSLFNVGWFPAAVNIKEGLGCEDEITVEVIKVSSKKLEDLDVYEGYDPSSPGTSLYLRKPFLDGFIYEYNRSVENLEKILSGDWFEFTKLKERNKERRF